MRAARLVAVLAAAACSHDESTAPPVPTSLALAQATAIVGTVGTALVVAPAIALRDKDGAFVSGVALTVTVTAGGGTITGIATRSSSGPTTLGQWTLGTVAGPNVLTVTAGTLPSLQVIATGNPDLPSQIVVVSGAAQAAPGNTTLPVPIAARVTDKFGNGIPSAPTAFTISLGGGTLGPGGNTTTNGTGVATAPTWTLGRTAAPQRLLVTSGALSTTIDATVATAFAPDLRFFGPPVDAGIQQSFIKAAQRLGGMITGDLPDVTLASFDVATTCGATGMPVITELVDDVVIFATVTAIDGVGKVLGSAGPCIIRNAALGRFTVVGVMRFDVADLQNLATSNRLDDVILHEMIHVVGFGTLWQTKSLIINAGTAMTAFIGLQAQQECVGAGGISPCAETVPLENTGGSGTADGHWRETVFRTELMTGFVSGVGIPNPLSLITIGSLADLGYQVNSRVNDAYALPSAISAQLQLLRDTQGLPVAPYGEELLHPRGEVGRGGRVTTIPELH